MRELVASVAKQKPVISLLDLDVARGGLTLDEVRSQIIELEAEGFNETWGFRTVSGSSMRSKGWHGALLWPGSERICEHLFESDPIEWNRIGHFQDVTMRLIAERIMSDAVAAQEAAAKRVGLLNRKGPQFVPDSTYVDGDLISKKLKPLPSPQILHHVYCSDSNPGATALMHEVAEARGFEVQTTGPDGSSVQRTVRITRMSRTRRTASLLKMTTRAADLGGCDHMLLYLNSQTWTRGQASAALADELLDALDRNVHVLLAHEMPSLEGNEGRHACEFVEFFAHPLGATPEGLLQRGIYSEIAVPLKGGAFRSTSMVLMGMALGMSREDLATDAQGKNLLGLDVQHLSIRTSLQRLQRARSRLSGLKALGSSKRLSVGRMSVKLGQMSVRRRTPRASQSDATYTSTAALEGVGAPEGAPEGARLPQTTRSRSSVGRMMASMRMAEKEKGTELPAAVVASATGERQTPATINLDALTSVSHASTASPMTTPRAHAGSSSGADDLAMDKI